MPNLVAKVKKEAIAACMICPLCSKLFRDATTISECLHTFCRKCIYKKLSDQELDCCPVCDIDLGGIPLEKLRPDHSLQDVRAKIFPFKRRKVNAPEVVPPITPTVKRKERSLSSLAVNAPRILTNGLTGKRSRSTVRKSLRGSSFSIGKLVKKQHDSSEDNLPNYSSPDILKKFAENILQNSSNAEPSHSLKSDEEKASDDESWEGKDHAWKPLNCLVEAANGTKSLNTTARGPPAKTEHLRLVEGRPRKTKAKEHIPELKVDTLPEESEQPKRLRRNRQRKSTDFVDFCVPPQYLLDATIPKYGRRIGPVWFSLEASKDQEGGMLLPQISSNYLRIKDGNVPVSFIQKYLMKKLNLTSEHEVELKCNGQLIVPALPLNDLVEVWLQTATSDRFSTTIGSPAKDFVMVLAYARRASSF